MCPRAADPALRASLVEVGARLLAEEGHSALSARRLAQEVGASTTAVYTYFGSMGSLRQAIRHEAFRLLNESLSHTTSHSRDSVADLAELTWGYWQFAISHGDLYRAAFIDPAEPNDDDEGHVSFRPIVQTVQRCISAGRLRPVDSPPLVARHLWAANHGLICAVLAGLIPLVEGEASATALGRALLVGFGDSPTSADASLEHAKHRIANRR